MDYFDEFLTNMQEAGTMTQKQRVDVMVRISEYIEQVCQPLTIQFGVNGIDRLLSGIIYTTLNPYVSFHDYKESNKHLLKAQISWADVRRNEIKGTWGEIMRMGDIIASEANRSENDNKKILRVVRSVFGFIPKLLLPTRHKWELNRSKKTIDDCINELEKEYNTEVYKLTESEKQKNIVTVQPLQPATKKVKRNEISNPAIGLFCTILNFSELRINNEVSAGDYCKKICNEFKFNNSEKIRQFYAPNFDIKTANKKHLEMIKKLILPNIPIELSKSINKYLVK